jgi:hypothetical protein
VAVVAVAVEARQMLLVAVAVGHTTKLSFLFRTWVPQQLSLLVQPVLGARAVKAQVLLGVTLP